MAAGHLIYGLDVHFATVRTGSRDARCVANTAYLCGHALFVALGKLRKRGGLISAPKPEMQIERDEYRLCIRRRSGFKASHERLMVDYVYRTDSITR